MKYLITFILLLVSSICFYIFACGPQYPDEVRFNIVKPSAFQQNDGFKYFSYSKHLFEYPRYSEEDDALVNVSIQPDENIKLWQKYCKNEPNIEDVQQVIYEMDTAAIQSGKTQNSMIKYLRKTNNKQAINYILFAKKCESLNRFLTDPWERDNSAVNLEPFEKKQQLIDEATAMAELSTGDIQLRYAFLATRLAFYNYDPITIKELYQKYFAARKQKNILDYWALHFNTTTQTEGASKNLNLARVYATAEDKRMAVIYEYKKTIPLASTLALAKNNSDKCDVYLLDAVRNPGQALANLKKMYSLNANPAFLDFLLLREMNKLEDWLYTPAYYLFPPSLKFEAYYYEGSYKNIFKNTEKDRAYAREVLHFVDSVSTAGVKNKILWNTSKAYLHFMLKEYDLALATTATVQKTITNNDASLNQVQMIEGLALIAKQEKGNAVIPEKVKPLLLKAFQSKSYPFIFAIAKELEYKGNTSDAALLMTKVNQGDAWQDENVYWKNSRGVNNRYVDFYWEYFGYIDAQYSAAQLQALVNNINSEKSDDKTFSEWKYRNVKKDMPRLYDLLGTKYIRENNLQAALNAFKKVDDTLWTSKNYPFEFYLAANPFYTNMYNEHTPTKADTIHYTKTTITSTLIDYLKKANDPSEKDRDYYYFLAANCYLNMTQYGNSWMMRRYYWTGAESTTGIVDDNEYFNCTLAKKHYLEAKKVSRNKKFAALCLRMAARCERHKLSHALDYANYSEQKVFQQNAYFKALKKEYPDYYDDLISNCESFESYFAARK